MIKFTNGLVLDKDFNIVKTDVYVDGNKIVKIGGELDADEEIEEEAGDIDE